MHRPMSKTIGKISTLGSFLAFGLCLGLSACSSQPTPAAAPAVAKPVNDFPTQARVEYVFQCMNEHGGQNYDNLYHCVCSADKIAEKIPYEDFAQAQTFTNFLGMAGDRGGEFRDPPQSEKLRNQLKETKKAAEEACFPKVIKNPSLKN
jgi:hypothetical protein